MFLRKERESQCKQFDDSEWLALDAPGHDTGSNESELADVPEFAT